MRQAQQIFDYAANQYATQPEYLWEKYPEYAILRHGNAKGKWYALIGKISKTKLGLKEEGETQGQFVRRLFKISTDFNKTIKYSIIHYFSVNIRQCIVLNI